MIQKLDGWEGLLANVFGDLELGFLYKSSAITSIQPLELLFIDEFDAFPREMYKLGFHIDLDLKPLLSIYIWSVVQMEKKEGLQQTVETTLEIIYLMSL